MTALHRAPGLRAGARVHVVAPSGPVDETRLARGLALLRREVVDRHGGELILADSLRARDGYLAGDDSLRLRGLQQALADEHASVIWCARGGYGATRLLARLDPEPLRRHPKLLVGFSDITALLAWCLTRAATCSLHGPVVTQLAELHEEERTRIFDMLRGEAIVPLSAETGATVHGGRVEGRLIVGNLEVLRSLIGTPYLPSLEGCILGLEEVGERPYRIDRALTQFASSGALRGVRAVIVGQLLECEDPPDHPLRGPTAEEVVIERLERLGVPMVTGFPFGHDRLRNAALPFGTLTRLDADNGTLECLDSPLA